MAEQGEQTHASVSAQSVRAAMELWHNHSTTEQSLAALLIYRQALASENGNVRRATNRVLNAAIEDLAVESAESARVLRLRYVELDRNGRHLKDFEIGARLNVSVAQYYRMLKAANARLADIIRVQDLDARDVQTQRLESVLGPPTYEQLFGAEAHIGSLIAPLLIAGPPWIVSIEGIGGIGKTSLADQVMRRLIRIGPYLNAGWVSARTQLLRPDGSIIAIDTPALSTADLVDRLSKQLLGELPNLSIDETANRLIGRLHQTPTLIVIDNLETVVDVQSLLPLLRRIGNPSKVILTSRRQVETDFAVWRFVLPELDIESTGALIRHDAANRNAEELAAASDDTIAQIYAVVGGNPQALRLIVGQTHVYPLRVVLEDLALQRGVTVEGLYAHIYQRTWDCLTERARRVLLATLLLPPAGGSLEDLMGISHENAATLHDIVQELIKLNVINSVTRQSDQRLLILHSLTRTFLHRKLGKDLT